MFVNKYTIFLQIFISYAIFSYNRKAVSFCTLELSESGLGNEHIGAILSLQNLAYAISKFLGGILSDKFSARSLFAFGLLVSGLSASLFSSVDSVALYSLAWFINGLAQGLGWPAIAKLLASWFKPEEMGTWWSLASASANMMGCIAPFIARHLIDNYGWRVSLQFAAAICCTASAVSFSFIRNSPVQDIKTATKSTQTTSTAASKKQDIVNKKPNTETNSKKPSSSGGFATLLTSPAILIVSVCYLIVSSLKTSITDWSNMFLIQELHHSKLTANSFLSSFELGGFFGGVFAGIVSDFFMRIRPRGPQDLGNARMDVALILSAPLVAILYFLCFQVTPDTSLMTLSSVGFSIGFSSYGLMALFGIVATQSVAKEMSGSAHAVVALAANIGSIAAGLPFATIAKQYSWLVVFETLTVMSIVTLVAVTISRFVSFNVGGSAGVDKKAKKFKN